MLNRKLSQKKNDASPGKESSSLTEPKHEPNPLNPTLRMAKCLTDRGDYLGALDKLSKHTNNPEELNCRGVCLLRLNKFSEAIAPFRMAALNTGTMQLHENIGTHIKINFAIALFYGGYIAGGLTTLSEIKADGDPGVAMINEQAHKWEQSMSRLQRIYWKLTGIAPSLAPPLPEAPIGRFVWDL